MLAGGGGGGTYHVSSVGGDAVLDSLNPSIRQDDRVLASHDPPVTCLLLVEVQPVVVSDGVAVPVGTQGGVGGRLSGRLLSLALSGRPGCRRPGPPPASDGVHVTVHIPRGESLPGEPRAVLCLGTANHLVLQKHQHEGGDNAR